MTWDEFKQAVEAELTRQEIPFDTPIAYIDISYPETYEDIEVQTTSNKDITVLLS